METKGLKNKHVAKLCKVSEQTFSSWRQNKSQPRLDQAAIIAKAIDISVGELITWEEEDH